MSVCICLRAYFTDYNEFLAYIKHFKQELGDTMNGENLETTMYYAVEDLKFFVEYKNSLTPEELVVSTIDFEGMGIN